MKQVMVLLLCVLKQKLKNIRVDKRIVAYEIPYQVNKARLVEKDCAFST